MCNRTRLSPIGLLHINCLFALLLTPVISGADTRPSAPTITSASYTSENGTLGYITCNLSSSHPGAIKYHIVCLSDLSTSFGTAFFIVLSVFTRSALIYSSMALSREVCKCFRQVFLISLMALCTVLDTSNHL